MYNNLLKLKTEISSKTSGHMLDNFSQNKLKLLLSQLPFFDFDYFCVYKLIEFLAGLAARDVRL